MANTTIQLKKSGTPAAQPATLANGEIAINYADGKLFYKDTLGNIQQISGGGNNFSTINAAGTLVVADLLSDILTLEQGNNIIITGDAINDKVIIAADLTAANAWANTKLSNGTVTLAGALTTTGQIYANSQITVYPLGGGEGGEIQLLGSDSYPDWSIDSYQDQLRFFTLNAGSQVVSFFNAGGGSLNMGINRGNPGYTLDVVGTINASSILVNGSPVGGSSDLTPANNFAGVMANSSNNWANTKLANTSGVMFEGNLNIKTDLWIGNNITNVSSIVFNTSTNRTPTTPGELTWSQDNSTLRFDMDSPSNVIGHIGQDLFYYVKNQSGSTINKGTVVRFAGTLGASGRLLIAPAIANNSYPSKYTMGVTAGTINNGDDGFVIAQGKIRGIDTSMFSEGDILYVSPSTAGALSNTSPTAPNNKITIAAVVKSDNTLGTIEVRVTLGSKLNEDELVELNTLTNGDILEYISANGRFENRNTLVSAFNKANNALANTSGVSFNGNLNIPTGNLAIGRTTANYKLDVVGSINAASILVNGSPITSGAIVSNTTPSSPSANSLWWHSDYGRLFIYYNDGDTSQWVDANPAQNLSSYYDLINLSFTVANASFGSSNTVGGYANQAGVIANAAFGSSNTAGSYANQAGVIANSAFGSSNTVGGYANQAGVIANAAFGLTNTTYAATNSVFGVANAAYTAANNAASTGKAIAMAIVFGG